MHSGHDLVSLAANRLPKALAIVDDRTDRRFTYEELLQESDIIAAGLWSRGVRAFDVVAVVLPNCFEHCLVLLALQRLNAIPAMMNFRQSAAEIIALITDGDIRHAILENSPHLADAIRNGSAILETRILVGSDEPAYSFDHCRAESKLLPHKMTPLPDQVAFIMYTSGTTGRPKGVLIPHRASESRMTCLASMIGLDCNTHWRVLGAAPMFHAIGFYLVFMQALAVGGTYYVMSRFNPDLALDLIERHKINFVFGVPTMFHALHCSKAFSPKRVASVRKVGYGGASMALTALETLSTSWNGSEVYNMYGSTEMFAAFYNSQPREAPTSFDVSIYHRARIIRSGSYPEDEVDVGEAGEIIVDMSSPQMFSGYWMRPDANVAKIRDGWYYTGDVGVRLSDSRVALVSRIDNAIRSGAESIYPEEIEELLGRYADIKDCCIVGVADPLWGQKVVACIVPHNVRPSLVEINQRLKDAGLASFKTPKALLVFKHLPRNGSSKLLRSAIAELASAALIDGYSREVA
jgi:2-furoate---CoA ligase